MQLLEWAVQHELDGALQQAQLRETRIRYGAKQATRSTAHKPECSMTAPSFAMTRRVQDRRRRAHRPTVSAAHHGTLSDL